MNLLLSLIAGCGLIGMIMALIIAYGAITKRAKPVEEMEEETTSK